MAKFPTGSHNMPILPPKTKFAPRVGVCSETAGVVLFYVHAAEAARMVREGVAVKMEPGKRVRNIKTIGQEELDRHWRGVASPGRLGVAGYICNQRLLEPGSCRCVEKFGAALKGCPLCKGRGVRMLTAGRVIQHKLIPVEDWPVFHSAVIECLPRSEQDEIRKIFSEPVR